MRAYMHACVHVRMYVCVDPDVHACKLGVHMLFAINCSAGNVIKEHIFASTGTLPF